MPEVKEIQKTSNSKLIDDFKAARRSGVPLICIQTADPQAIINQITALMEVPKMKDTGSPIISFDIASGIKAHNEAGKEQINLILTEVENKTKVKPRPDQIVDSATALKTFSVVEQKTIVFMINAHRVVGSRDLQQAIVNQAIWNLRELFKSTRRTLILLCPLIQLPVELKHDVLILEDPLPNAEELTAIAEGLALAWEEDERPEKKDIIETVEATRGLTLFEAEQVMAMSMTSKGFDMPRMWLKKKTSIEQTPGLRIWSGTETFADVRGVEVIKDYLTKIMAGEEPPTVFVYWDEMEKAFAGAKGDSSGVSQEMHGQILSWMADNDIMAIRFAGIQGCSKSYISKAVAGQYRRPLIINNLSDLKSKYVGESTGQLKSALNTISAVGKPLVMATCNDEEALSTELKDRFNLSTFFFDLPTKSEREAVWDIWKGKLKIKSNHTLINDIGWTPRNIHDCCTLAWRLRITLGEASSYIVPTSRSAPERITQLRKMADRKYLSASKRGVYEYIEDNTEEQQQVARVVKAAGNRMGEA